MDANETMPSRESYKVDLGDGFSVRITINPIDDSHGIFIHLLGYYNGQVYMPTPDGFPLMMTRKKWVERSEYFLSNFKRITLINFDSSTKS